MLTTIFNYRPNSVTFRNWNHLTDGLFLQENRLSRMVELPVHRGNLVERIVQQMLSKVFIFPLYTNCY
jgi:hypothetical protein